MHARLAERAASPSEVADLPEPADLGDTGIAANATDNRGDDEFADQPVARRAALVPALVAIEAEARYFEGARPARYFAVAQVRIEGVEQVRACRRQQPRRRTMVARLVEQDDVSRVRVVEPVELELPAITGTSQPSNSTNISRRATNIARNASASSTLPFPALISRIPDLLEM
jgi:hypothetical protein